MVLTTWSSSCCCLWWCSGHTDPYSAKASSTGPLQHLHVGVRFICFMTPEHKGQGRCSNLGHPKFITSGRNVDLPPVASSVFLGETHSSIFEGCLFYISGRGVKRRGSTGVKENKIWNAGIRRESFKQKERWGGKSMHSCGFYGMAVFFYWKSFLVGFALTVAFICL